MLQLGAGFIGCIIMKALVKRGVPLTVFEVGDRIVPRMMTPEAGGMIKRWFEKQGGVLAGDEASLHFALREQNPLALLRCN